MKIYSEYSFWWIFFIVVFSLLVTYVQYYYKIKKSIFSNYTRIILFFIRFFLLLIVGILLLNLYSKFFKNEYIKPLLVLAIDNSKSMISAKDSAEVKKFFSDKFSSSIQSLEEKFDVQIISFGEKIKFRNDSILFNELKTNPENIFNEIQQTYGHKPVHALLMITDGIFNEGIHPISLTDYLDYPIYVVATGDTNIYKDVSIKKILCNKNVFIGNDFIAEILIHSSAINNEKSKVSIYDGKQLLTEKEIVINSEKNNVLSVQFQLHADKGGHHIYKAVVAPVQDEKNTQNNVYYFAVNVIEDKTKILILYSAPHPDISAIKQILINFPQYETDTYYDAVFTKELTKYDVIVYHTLQPKPAVFEKCLHSDIPMFIISNQLSILQNKLVNIKQYSSQYNETEAHFNTSFSSYAVTEDYSELVPHLPFVYTPYGNYSPAGEADVLLYQKINNVITELPLFFFTQSAQKKYAIFLGDGLWRWKMANYQLKQNHEWFSHLITQTIRYLTIKRDKSPFKVIIPPSINESEPLQVSAEFYNESMQNITEPDVFLKLISQDNIEYKFVFNKSTHNYFLNAGVLPSGEYKYTANTQYKGKEYTQSGKIHIIPMSVETSNLMAQHQLLKTMAVKTNGKFYYLKDFDKLVNELNTNENTQILVVQNETYQYWIDNKWWLFIILAMAFAEWSIRRWNGVI